MKTMTDEQYRNLVTDVNRLYSAVTESALIFAYEYSLTREGTAIKLYEAARDAYDQACTALLEETDRRTNAQKAE